MQCSVLVGGDHTILLDRGAPARAACDRVRARGPGRSANSLVCVHQRRGGCVRADGAHTHRAARAVRARTVRVRAHVRACAVCFRPRCGRGRCVPLGVRCRTRQFGS